MNRQKQASQQLASWNQPRRHEGRGVIVQDLFISRQQHRGIHWQPLPYIVSLFDLLVHVVREKKKKACGQFARCFRPCLDSLSFFTFLELEAWLSIQNIGSRAMYTFNFGAGLALPISRPARLLWIIFRLLIMCLKEQLFTCFLKKHQNSLFYSSSMQPTSKPSTNRLDLFFTEKDTWALVIEL